MSFDLQVGRPLTLIRALSLTALSFLASTQTRAEIIFQDNFSQPTASVTDSIPLVNVQGNSWQSGPLSPDLSVDNQGHLFNPSTTFGATAGVQLIPIGRDGSMAASATVNLPAGSTEWIGFGFGRRDQALAATGSQSGPWLKVQGNGSLTLYGGSGATNGVTVPSAFTNLGPLRFILTYDAFLGAASVAWVNGGASNAVLTTIPVTNTLGSVQPRYLIFQFPSNPAPAQVRWVAGVSVDWFPRPRPLLSLPTPNVVTVGPPTGQSDIHLIQTALNAAAGFTNGVEVRFTAGATYHIATNTTAPGVPLLLARATNVVVNGNGCKILITNPRIGFLDFYLCRNVIAQGFSVDYDPLPFTQGVVTTNLSATADAFEFRVDPGYPAPTNAYFLEIAQWGTFMDATRPGRLADNHSTIYEFGEVAGTATSDVFKVTLHNRSKLPTIQTGDKWCQLARFNGSTLFRTRYSYQVTYLNLTNYTGAAAAFAGNASSLVNEINCQVIIGPSPGGSNGVPRVKTTNADGGLFGNPRIGPWVEGCNFIGLSDDVANANTLPFFVVGPVQLPTNTFHLMGYDPGGSLAELASGDVAVGDDITFYNGTNGVVLDRANITAVNPPFVTFDHTIAGIFPGQDTTNTCLFDNSLNSSAVYLNNQFSNSRIHGIYCRANNILIAHNYITGMGASAIAAHPALSLAGPNSFIPTNAVILANLLADGGCSYEAINNADPDDEPVWALLQLHKATANSDYVPVGQEISGVRILNNTFLQWRRGAITLHNVTDARIMGNYFGPPLTNNGLTALTNHVAADLWACDYAGLRIARNVMAPPLQAAESIREDGNFVAVPGAFQAPTPPRLAITFTDGNLSVGWTNSAPGFVLQQADGPGAVNNWVDVPVFPYVLGSSNVVTLPFPNGEQPQFYRAREW